MVIFKDFSRSLSVFSSTFQGKFNFQGLFKTVLYIQVLFKLVRILQAEDASSEDSDRPAQMPRLTRGAHWRLLCIQ